jgi:3-oxoacyl-[acyl-carrier-protein] synthase II
MSAPIAITGGHSARPDGAELPVRGVAAALRERIARVERLPALALLAAAGALEAAGLGAPGRDTRRPREEVGVVLGTAFGCFLTNAEYQRRFAAGGVPAASPRLFASTVSNAAAGEVAIAFGLAGPGITLTAGAASGTVALAHAAAALAGTAPYVEALLAGGADAAGDALSAWIGAGGFAAGPAADAATLLVLEPLAAARRRGASVRGTILGWAVGFEPVPPRAGETGAGLRAAVERALAQSGVAGRDVATVFASGSPSGRAACALAAAGPHAVLEAVAAEPAGRVTLVVDACTSGHLAAMVVRSGAVG